jgi:hypothetical protein
MEKRRRHWASAELICAFPVPAGSPCRIGDLMGHVLPGHLMSDCSSAKEMTYEASVAAPAVPPLLPTET